MAQMVKGLPAMWVIWVQSLAWEDLLEKGMATHSSTLAWKIPWTEEPCKLQSMGSQRVGHDWATKHSTVQYTPVKWSEVKWSEGSMQGLLNCRKILYHLSHQGSPRILEWVAYSFSRGSSYPRNWTGVSCISRGLFTSWTTRCILLQY